LKSISNAYTINTDRASGKKGEGQGKSSSGEKVRLEKTEKGFKKGESLIQFGRKLCRITGVEKEGGCRKRERRNKIEG